MENVKDAFNQNTRIVKRFYELVGNNDNYYDAMFQWEEDLASGKCEPILRADEEIKQISKMPPNEKLFKAIKERGLDTVKAEQEEIVKKTIRIIEQERD